jgi:hypothetical protein
MKKVRDGDAACHADALLRVSITDDVRRAGAFAPRFHVDDVESKMVRRMLRRTCASFAGALAFIGANSLA